MVLNMTTQLERDWEEQQHGLQGTITGSAHNQIGLDSRMPAMGTAALSDKTQRPKAQQSQQDSATRHPQASVSFNIPTALIGFAGVCYWFYDAAQESLWPLLVGAAIAAALAGRFYKPIWGLTLAVGGLYLFGLYGG
jgi:hypothetical protein